MSVSQDRPAPYAPAAAVIGLIDRHRSKGLPTPMDAGVLARANVSDSLVPRTLQALQSLDLIDERGKPTQVFENLRRASEEEYRQRLSEWLRAAYADVLTYVDPATDSEARVRDAFRHYKPVSMQTRMAALFMALFRLAGIAPASEKSAPARKPVIRSSVTRVRTQTIATQPGVSTPAAPGHTGHGPGAIPPALAGLLAGLPSSGETWTQAARDRFVVTFEAVLDYCFPISEAPTQNGKENHEGESPK